MSKKRFIIWVFPVILLVIFASAEIVGLFRSFEDGFYDAWLHVKPEVPEDEAILFLDIDDLAIARVGVWPWSRSTMAEGLLTLSEFGSGPVVFDIEYVDTSPAGVDRRVLNEQLPSEIAREFGALTGNVEQLLQAVAAGQLTANDALSFFGDLEQSAQSSRDALTRGVQGVVRDNDALLGRAARMHGNAWFTVNMLPEYDPLVPREYVQTAEKRVRIEGVQGESTLVSEARGIRPAIPPILGSARGAGFPNVVIDPDGTRRRIQLLKRYDDGWYGQLVFAPLLAWLGNPEVSVDEQRVVLRNALIPGSDGARDITIPLAEDGTLLINWPRADYIDSFRHMSYAEAFSYRRWLEDLAFNLQVMADAGYATYNPDGEGFLSAWQALQERYEKALREGSSLPIEEVHQIRSFFFEATEAFLSGPAEESLIGDIDEALADPRTDEATRAEYTAWKEEIRTTFTVTRNLFGDLVATKAELEEGIPNSFVIIGYTGTGTTDIGVNPFHNEYANTGTHGAVVNTIINERYIDDLPLWISIVVAGILTILFIATSRNLSATGTVATGAFTTAIVLGGSALTMIVFSLYLPVMVPTLTIITATISQSTYKYIEVAREKTFIRTAFNHYLSTDVINEIMDDPTRLQLGGEKRELTAVFTDVKGFSTISEQLDPEDLVKLLNRYLSQMSDIILDLRGTIDKYEGDAIISFFGAPVTYADHAVRACRSAIRMKKIEAQLNETFLEEKITPNPLATRIGLNTGEMVVGNMGTANRMDYTIMGHSVNLAARLEGVNKQYGTWILASEMTYNQTEDAFAARKLDRVRVVGVREPVRLYEIVDERSVIDEPTRQLLSEFDDGLGLFEARQWKEAANIFARLLKDFPDDGPSKTYHDRAATFLKDPPTAKWDGVFNLTSK